ncbi:helix-turn-helix domain-containing protein [Sphingomonas sp. NFR15]|uniref:helix-turn-helix domain-containing protein n=1 Tax=Sphingomonas sp. NFR15 TaxID=1566282 RepID=UPI00088815D0|nr:helix-turn-helix transcriptional regulator [Sphingomonas sp. NFR15]SDA36907.1 Helix-turn-helix [Sphingomonas sp. NFR15]
MKHSSIEIDAGVRILTQSLRAIRKKRGMTASDIAAALEMPLRTYQAFESGRGPLTHERLFNFAEVTDSDPFALLFGAIFALPDLAIDCADTKFGMIMMMYFQEFARERGGDIAYLDPPNLAGGFDRLFKDFGAVLADRERFLRNWLANRTGSIGLSALRQRMVNRRDRKAGEPRKE